MGLIPIHFDVPGHHLPLDVFIQTATSTRVIVDAFNDRVFSGKLHYQLVILPPEDGTFLAKLGFILVAGWGAVWTFTASDVGKAFVKGLTKHEPAYWFERTGAALREFALDENPPNLSEIVQDKEKRSVIGQFETMIVTESTKSFFQSDKFELQKIQINPQTFRDAFEARNDFYRACGADNEIQAVGFEDTDDFLIKRKDFARLQVAVPPKEEMLVDMPWKVETTILKVTSPDWEKDDRQRRWKGRDPKNRERLFSVDDEHFWGLVAARKLDPHIIDQMKVQLAYTGEKRANARVLKVIEYNDVRLGEALNDNALSAVLGAYNQIVSGQDDLFGRQ
jgi:hypothetical protein